MGKINVFTVEDNNLYSLVLDYKMKELSDFKLHNFKTGEECLENLHENPDIIVLDYNLPGINGLETLKKIKQMGFDTKVIFLSGEHDKELAKKCIEEGAIEFIVKDKKAPEKLFRTISNVVVDKDPSKKTLLESVFGGLKNLFPVLL